MFGGAVGTSVLFAINTTGAKKSKLAWGLVAAAVVAVALALNKTRLAAEEFDQTFKRLTLSQREVVRAMERSTKGLVDTKAEMDAVVKMTEAANGQFAVTPKLMTSIGVLATDMAQKLGEGPEGATRRMNQLTEAIMKGNSRALKPFGFEIEHEGTLLEMQQEGMRKVIERAKGLTITMTTLTEQTFALNNNWETFLGLTLGSAGTIGVIGDLDRAFSSLNDSMMSADDGFADAALSLQGFMLMADQTIYELLGMTNAADNASRAFGRLWEAESAKKKKKATKHLRDEKELQGIQEWKGGVTAEGSVAFDAAPWEMQEQYLAREAELVKSLTAHYEKLSPYRTPEEAPEKKKSGGGGGGGKLYSYDEYTKEDLAAMDYEEAFIDATTPGLGGDVGPPSLEGMGGGAGPQLVSPEAVEDAASLNEILGERLNLEKELMEIDAELVVIDAEMRNEQWAMELETAESEKQLQAEKHEWLLQNSEEYKDAQLQLARAEALGRMDLMAQMFGNVSALMNTENRKLFAIGKAAAIAGGVVNTASAAIKALQVGLSAGFPVGIVLGPAMMAAALIAGGVQIASIAKTEFGSGAGGISSGASGGMGGGSFGGGAFSGGMAQTPESGGGAQQITIYIGDEKLQDLMINSNDSAQQQGLPSFSKAS